MVIQQVNLHGTNLYIMGIDPQSETEGFIKIGVNGKILEEMYVIQNTFLCTESGTIPIEWIYKFLMENNSISQKEEDTIVFQKVWF